jgi:adenylate cyclase
MKQEILQNISDEAKLLLSKEFSFKFTNTRSVPTYEDAGFTFERCSLKKGKKRYDVKKGKTITTCVLHIDIRNSTQINLNHTPENVAKLYTAFIKAMIWIADEHNGFVRNIIGDRLMIVFPTQNCFVNAVECAISMNTVATNIINYHFKHDNFSCGIGIDYGEMYVLKTGVAKMGKERTNYKNLIWLGNPANIASKLTDVANKPISEMLYKVRYQSKGATKATQKTLSIKEYNEKIVFLNGIPLYKGKKIVSIENIPNNYHTPAILMTENVYKNYSQIGRNNDDVKQKFWEIQKAINLSDYSGKIYGADIDWEIIRNIKK